MCYHQHQPQLDESSSYSDKINTTLHQSESDPNSDMCLFQTATTAASSNIITDLLNTAFTAAIVSKCNPSIAWKYQPSTGLFQPFFQLSAGIVGLVGPLFSPPPSQQRSDAASARFFLPQHYNKISPPFLEGPSKRCGQVGTSGGATGTRFGPASMYDLLARYTPARYIATKVSLHKSQSQSPMSPRHLKT